MAWGDEVSSEPFPNPQTPEEEAANEEWLKGFNAKRAERDQEWATQKVGAIASPIGEPELDMVYSALEGLRAAEPRTSPLPLRMKRVDKSPAVYEPKVIQSSTAAATTVEPDLVLAEQLESELAGFPAQFRGYLLDTYNDSKKRSGSPQSAYKDMMKARQDIMRGPAEMTGWPDFPNGLPTELFWERYLGGSDRAANAVIRYAFKDFVERGYQDAGLNAAELEHMRQSGITPGPMDGLTAFRALQEYEKVHWPQGRPRSQSGLL